VAEATVAYTIANEFLRKFGGDSVPEIRRHVEADRRAHAEADRAEEEGEK
jgi:chorismate synthase